MLGGLKPSLLDRAGEKDTAVARQGVKGVKQLQPLQLRLCFRHYPPLQPAPLGTGRQRIPGA